MGMIPVAGTGAQDDRDWTTDPLPAGVGTVIIGSVCPTCHAERIDSQMFRGWQRMTRTVDPDNGEYTAQPHEAWCPRLTGETAEVGCPRCGAEVMSYEFHPGYSAAVPDPVLGTAHLVGNADEVFGHPSYALATEPAKREPTMDQLELSPCGHILDSDMGPVLEKIAGKRQRRAERELADAEPLLAVAEAAGSSSAVNAYREAVRSGAVGAAKILLAALRELHPQPLAGYTVPGTGGGQDPLGLLEQSWRCMVCGDLRYYEQIGVQHRPVRGHEAAFPGSRWNVKYCVDRPACVAQAKEEGPWDDNRP